MTVVSALTVPIAILMPSATSTQSSVFGCLHSLSCPQVLRAKPTVSGQGNLDSPPTPVSGQDRITPSTNVSSASQPIKDMFEFKTSYGNIE